MKWKDLVCLLALLVVFLTAGRAEAADVQLDGETISTSVDIVANTAYVPLREFLDGVGGWELSWNGSSRTATATGPHFTLSFPIDRTMLLDGTPYSVSVSYLKNGVTYVPLRSLAQLCGLSVQWQGSRLPILLSATYPTYSEEDLYWLSRIISAESQGEPFLGQLAVGTVVLNRVASSSFPNTITGVIFDENGGTQFEPVSNGAIYWEPTASSIRAARLCLEGVRVAGNSLFFYAPALSAGTWINANRPYHMTIGNHRFFL